MREILFRAKRLDNNAWVEGYLEKRPSPIQMPGYGGPWYIWVPPQDPDDNGGFYNVDPRTVGQYTGCKDRKGERIFEGDILESRFSEYREDWKRWVVRFEDGAFVAESREYGSPNGKKRRKEDLIDICADEIDLFGFERIGNIHDDPELRKELQE